MKAASLTLLLILLSNFTCLAGNPKVGGTPMQTRYRFPPILDQLESIHKETFDQNGLEALSFYIEIEEDRYAITPVDVLPFAWTGGAGIHFGFLTDFGKTTDLNQASIVCVSPTNDPPITIVAGNIYEFLAIVCKIKRAEALDDIDFNVPENQWIRKIEKDWFEDKDDLENANHVSRVIQQRFKLEAPNSIYEAIQGVRSEREKSILIPTLDGLGIIGSGNQTLKPSTTYRFADKESKDLAKIKRFAQNASYEQKLALCRDAQYACILSKDYDHDIQLFIAEMLHSMGLVEESKNILKIK